MIPEPQKTNLVLKYEKVSGELPLGYLPSYIQGMVHDISRYCPRYSKVLSIMDIFIHLPNYIFQGMVRDIPRYCPRYSKVLSIFVSFDIL